MIFFSIIIPAYNRADFIAETVDTVLQQTYLHFEVIIVDDGSTDNTKQVIEGRYSNDARVKYFFKQNEERGAARNYGLKAAKGEYAVFFDSDDLMKTHYLNTLAQIIEKNPDIFLLATCYNFINKEKNESPAPIAQLQEGWYDRNYFLSGNILACNYCIRLKENSLRFFEQDHELATMEDWLFLLSNLENHKIFISKEVCVSMRQHDEQSMRNNKKVIEARKKATEWVIKNLNLSESEKKKLIAWSHYFCGIHQYLDYNRTASVQETLSAIKSAGLNNKFLVLLAKSIIGRKVIKATG